VASDGGLTVALDLEPTEELRHEGLAREIVRIVQDARKAAGLEVSDRIVLGLAASGSVSEAIDKYADSIARETLAIELRREEVPDASFEQPAAVEGTEVMVTLRRA
jgi:isoleucyl-tRNA synthetase